MGKSLKPPYYNVIANYDPNDFDGDIDVGDHFVENCAGQEIRGGGFGENGRDVSFMWYKSLSRATKLAKRLNRYRNLSVELWLIEDEYGDGEKIEFRSPVETFVETFLDE